MEQYGYDCNLSTSFTDPNKILNSYFHPQVKETDFDTAMEMKPFKVTLSQSNQM